MRKKIAHHSMRWTFILIFISLVFVAFFTGAARISLPLVGTYRAEIQNYVSTFLGKTIEIGALDMSWQKFGPRLVLNNVVLDSGIDSSQNVNLEKIYLDLDLLRSWVNGVWQINEVSIVGAELSVEYYDQQNIRVYGASIDSRVVGASTSEGLDVMGWLMQADRVGLLDSSVTLRNMNDGFSLDVRDLNIRANNRDGKHQIRIDFSVPSVSEDTVALNVDFSGERQRLLNSVGSFDFTMQDIDLATTTKLLSDWLPFSVVGESNLALWGRWANGEVNSLRVQTALGETQWLNKDTMTTLGLPESRSDWVIVNADGEYKIALNELQLGGVDEDLGLLLKVVPQAQRRWSLSAEGRTVELAPLMPVVQFLAELVEQEPAKRQLLASLSGQLEDWHFEVEGQHGQFPRISADAVLNNLSLGNDPQLPGFTALDARLAMQDNRGRLHITDDQLSVNLPKWFNVQHDLSRLETVLEFGIEKGRFAVQSDKVFVESGGLSAIARLKIQKNTGHHLYLDIEAESPAADVVSVRRFFPEKIMKPQLLSWLDSAVLSGNISNARVTVKGPSKGFPYAQGEGVFNAEFDFHDGKVKAIKNWPDIDVVAATAEFRQNSMSLDVIQAVTRGNALSDVNLSIADLKRPVVKLQGLAKGTMRSAMSYIRETSLKDSLAVVLDTASGTGDIALDLDLTAPIYENAPPMRFEGDIAFNGSSWRSEALGLNLQDINGPLHFSDKSLTTEGLTAYAFGSPVRITADSDTNNSSLFSRIQVTGHIDPGIVLENYDLPVSHWFEGSSPWQLQLELRRAAGLQQAMQVSLLAKSDLIGTAVSLPYPYGKPASRKGQLSANLQLKGGNTGQRWNVSYARNLRARVETSPNGEGLNALIVRLNEPLPPVTESFEGVSLEGRVAELAFDDWISSIAGVISRLQTPEKRAPLMPVVGALQVDEMILGQVNSGPASMKFITDANTISAEIDSKWLSGSLHYPRLYWLANKPLKARLTLLDKQFLGSLATAEGADQSRIDPREFPPMELVIDQFIWDEFRVADLVLRTSPVADGMKTTALGFVHRDLQMSGDAYWRLLDPQSITTQPGSRHRTDISFSLKSDDVGAGLEGIGVSGAFAGGQGQLDVNLAWDDAAYAPGLTKIKGTIKPRLEGGHILAVEPGAAKILGLFALQAVPRRLLLDFNDVTQEGLLYDEISGDIVISDGVATTNYMQLNGPIGVVSSSGQTDFVNSTYDQEIVVLPRISSALPIIGLISAGATAGVGVLVADQVLKGVGVNFDEVGKREYRLTGSWDEPKIERVQASKRQLAQPDNR